jgi:peptidoglycan/LPS O-acetylase OafA/YrhL
LSTRDRPRRAQPAWITWALALPGILALVIAVVDYSRTPIDNVAFRAKFALLAVVLLVLAWASDRRAARLRQARRRGPR